MKGGPTAAGTVRAWIAQEGATAGPAFVAYVEGEPGFVGRYELVGEKAGRSGRSRTRQSGSFRTRSDAPMRLAQLSLGVLDQADEYSVVLTVHDDAGVIAADRVAAGR